MIAILSILPLPHILFLLFFTTVRFCWGSEGWGGQYRVCGVCVDHTVKGVDVDFTVFKENVFDKMCV